MDIARSNGVVFICGEDTSLCDEEYILPTKSILISNLATNWAVRTHYDPNGNDPRSSKEILFRNISNSHVFLFIFSEETTMNAFYLNQLGIAFARGLPILGIREPSYIMPNPLPEHYYVTEVVDLTSGDNRNRPRSRSKAILSNLLIESFRNAVVYTTDFHKSCIERLFRKVTDAYTRAEKERTVPPSLTVTDYARNTNPTEPTFRQKLWTSVSGFTKCPKCGTAVKTNRKSSGLQKTNSVDNLYKKETSRPTSRQHVTTPQLVITKSVLQPLAGQQTFSRNIFNGGSRRPATSVMRKSSSATVRSRREMDLNHYDDVQSRPNSTKSCNAISTTRGKTQTQVGIENVDTKQNGLTEVENVKENKSTTTPLKENDEKRPRKKSTTGFVTNRRGAFLRKMSSLPCIPTTYLVAEPGSEAPAFVKYPPLNGSLTVGDPNVPEFTDDEDKETIHISRRPSPAISTCSTNIE
jgi:hypothetical protein